MSKTIKITIAGILIILILGLIGFLFFYKNSNGASGIDIIKSTLPFGKTPNKSIEIQPTENTNNDITSTSTVEKTSDITKLELFQIHKDAIAGYYAFKNKNDVETLRYLGRGIGHIFETGMKNLKEVQISNTTRLKIYRAIWGNSGKNVVIRYLDNKDESTIRSFDITLADTKSLLNEEASSTQTQETKGVFLPEDIKNIALSAQDDKKIFYLFNAGNSSIGIIYNLDNGKSSQVFQSPFTQWISQWPNNSTITLTTKAEYNTPGFLYFLNTKTQKLTKILGDINGLTTLTSPDGNRVLYSKSDGGGVSLNIYNIKTHSSNVLPLSTLPEKCIWSKANTDIIYCAVPNNPQTGSYPDQWYKGEVSFSDDIWMINVKTNTPERILSPSDTAREKFDVINLQTDASGKFIFFMNKKDMSLWSIKLPEKKKTLLD